MGDLCAVDPDWLSVVDGDLEHIRVDAARGADEAAPDGIAGSRDAWFAKG